MAQLIAALATAPQASAVGILRLSGEGCIEALSKVFRSKSQIPAEKMENRKLYYGELLSEDGTVLDTCLATVSRAPHSYTGEDTAELQCHGAPAVLSAALSAVFAAGARQAAPGEFTKRAFLSGKLDLSQAEAVIDLIEAPDVRAAKNAAGQLGGALSKKILPIYASLTDMLAHFHAVLDYPDEEIPPFRLQEFEEMLTKNLETLRALERSYARGQFYRRGVPCVILGSPNAGKSSLLNALAGYERVIVTATAGTTRDTVEETVRVGDKLLRLTDTAGIRQTENEIEAMGVERSRQAAENAHLALFVCDGTKPLTREDEQAMAEAKKAPLSLGIINKSDLPLAVTELPFQTVVTLSAKEGLGLEGLEEALCRLLDDGAVGEETVVTNPRQKACVTRACEALERLLCAMKAFTPDAALLDAEDALEALGEITGKHMREEIVGRIFERFCVGK